MSPRRVPKPPPRTPPGRPKGVKGFFFAVRQGLRNAPGASPDIIVGDPGRLLKIFSMLAGPRTTFWDHFQRTEDFKTMNREEERRAHHTIPRTKSAGKRLCCFML